MSIQEILTAGGGTLIVLLTLVQIAPIKLNPWSAIIKWIGHALNAEVLERQQETQKSWMNTSGSMMSGMRTFFAPRF